MELSLLGWQHTTQPFLEVGQDVCGVEKKGTSKRSSVKTSVCASSTVVHRSIKELNY